VRAAVAIDNRATMPIDRRILILLLVLLAGAIWWLLGDNPEERVRAAHQELAERLSKSEDDGENPSIRDVLAYQSMFAERVTISGDADDLGGSYAPDDIAALIIRVRTLFDTIELMFSDPVIEFPTEETAVARFTATLTVSPTLPDVTDGTETRNVTSHLQLIEGDWLFSAFEMQPTGAD
jgi:hypothetical protein